MQTKHIDRRAMDWFFDSDILQVEGTDDGALFVLADSQVDERFQVMSDDEIGSITKVFNSIKWRPSEPEGMEQL